MNINWKIKSYIFGVIDKYRLSGVLYFIQRYITKRSLETYENIPAVWLFHEKWLNKFNTKVILEFGAGKSLAQNLYLSDTCSRQVLVDINPMLDISLVEKARIEISKFYPFKFRKKITTITDLSSYGISYIAPLDVSKTDFEDCTFDAVISTNTLEHIPGSNLIDIFKELHRITKRGGIVTARIDYSDHYSHTDSSISRLNYLRYSDDTWTQYNHACHFQNRLRHMEYLEIFTEVGFELLYEELNYGEKNIPVELAEVWKNEHPSWSATSADIVLLRR